MPYLEINQANQEEIEQKSEVTMVDITNKTIEEAEKILKDNGLELRINNEQEGMDKKNTLIKNQIPQAGIKIYQGSCVYVDY